MRRADLLRRPVRDLAPKDWRGVDGLVRAMARGGGFSARELGRATGVLEAMARDRRCLRFLSFPAAIVATGLRGVLVEALRRGLFDAIVTTCGTVDHDLARTWGAYYEGSFDLDDAALRRMDIHRLGNVLVPKESYGPLLEKRLRPMFEALWREGKRTWTTPDLLWEVGRRVRSRSSLLAECSRRRVPVFVPGLMDGAFGLQLWSFWQEHRDFRVDPYPEESRLADLVFTAKRTGALMIGGGISKHHVLWWNQFHDGLDYAVYLTTALEYDGSLSGARVKEGISWGKVRARARQVTVQGEATVLLPMLLGATMERVGRVTRALK